MAPGFRTLGFLLARVHAFRHWVAREFTLRGELDSELVDDVCKGTYRSTIDSYLSMRRTDLVPQLASLTVPTLAVGTDRDRVVAPGQHALIPGAEKAEFKETGHMPMLERPEAFHALLARWLDGAQRPGGR